jgi:hypothetical protein
MNARKSLLAAITAITLGLGAFAAHASSTVQPLSDMGLSPAYARLFACTGLCSRVGLNAENACEADVRAGGDTTSDDLALCLLEGIHAEQACLEQYHCLE